MRSVEGVQIDWPEDDVRALWKQIERNRKEFGRSLGKSVKLAAWHLVRSMGADTRVAPKYRPYKEIKETKKQRDAKGGGKKYEITTWKGGQKKTFNIRSKKGVKELKQMPQVRIGNRGLAKASWRFAVSQFGAKGGVSKKGITRGAERYAKRHMDVKKKLNRDDAYVKITNRVDYIIEAMHGKKHAVDSAMARAARGMSHHIDEQIKKKMGVK